MSERPTAGLSLSALQDQIRDLYGEKDAARSVRSSKIQGTRDMQRRRQWWRWPWAALAALALAGPARAEGPIEVERLRIGLDAQADQFKVGAWVPVRVQLKAGSERFE